MDYSKFFSDEIDNKKKFNSVGLCIPQKHYMVNIDDKLREIIALVQKNNYFIINRPRQFGKTTTLNLLGNILKTRYKVISIDFELLSNSFETEEKFCTDISNSMIEELNIDIEEKKITTILELSNLIRTLTATNEIILIIDEVDKVSNEKMFLSFLGMLRSLYLSRESGKVTTFKSVILAGVHDVRNLKLKFRDNTDTKYNSPWNIAVEFNVDMKLNLEGISDMLKEYSDDNKLEMDCYKIGKLIYNFSGGYPFIVSRICQIIDEKVVKEVKRSWKELDVQKAIKIILEEKNTLFDDLVKNLENNEELYEYIYNILIVGTPVQYNNANPIIDMGTMFGYFVKDENNNVDLSNQVMKEYIYNYMISKTNTKEMTKYNFKENFITDDNGINMEKVLLKFQQFMKENYSTRDKDFLERQGVLLFIAFIKPIINGVGFDYKEVQISEERRLDIVIQYNQYKYIVETKIWYGERAHEKGLSQLYNYLEIEDVRKGYLLIFNFNKNKKYDNREYFLKDKSIFEVRV